MYQMNMKLKSFKLDCPFFKDWPANRCLRLLTSFVTENYSKENISSIILNIKTSNLFSNILIFSDDIEWCKNNLHFDFLHYIEGNEPYKDMILMSLCDYVIPNPGSFSV